MDKQKLAERHGHSFRKLTLFHGILRTGLVSYSRCGQTRDLQLTCLKRSYLNWSCLNRCAKLSGLPNSAKQLIIAYPSPHPRLGKAKLVIGLS